VCGLFFVLAEPLPNERDLVNYTDWYIFATLMTKGERTRAEIIEKTAPLFNTRGYDGTSLASLCEVTGLSKGALYGNFADKEELAQEAFEFSVRCVKKMVRERVDAKTTYREKLTATVEFFATYVMNPPVKGGCPLLNAAIEADDYRTSMRKRVAIRLEDMVVFLTALLDDGKKAGEFKRQVKSRELALFFFCAIEGAIMFSRTAGTEEAMRMVTKNIRSIIDTISES